MKCSVIIPYYKRKNAFLKTLHSLNNQQFDKNEFEVVIINDGCDDLTEEEILMGKYSINRQYFKFNRDENSGRSSARNRGIDNSKGDILIFLDNDQIVGKNFIEKHYYFFKNIASDTEILQIGTRKHLFPAVTDNQDKEYNTVEELNNKYELLKIGKRKRIENPEFYGQKDLSSFTYIRDIRHKIFTEFSCNLNNVKGNFALVQSHNISLKKKILEKYGGFDTEFKGWGCEDWELGYRLAKNGVKIVFNPEIEVLHEYHPMIYDEELYRNWSRNLNYFISKYQELPVILLKVLSGFYNPEEREVLSQKKDIDDVWVHCFRKFEFALQAIDDERINNRQKLSFLINPTILELENIRINNLKKELIVLCKKQNIKLISYIQTCKQSEMLKLYYI